MQRCSGVSPIQPQAAALPVLPSPEKSQVWIDFDGTLTCADLLDELISRYSRNDSWKLIEERWRAGQIGSRDCLEQEFALLDMSAADVAAELAAVRLDPGTPALLNMLRDRGIPTAILSDGIGSFIEAILRRNNLTPPPVRANAIIHEGTSLRLVCPHSSASCTSKSAHCKCSSREALASRGKTSIYIGDGRSDLCASRTADIVFAKGALAAALTAEGIAFRPFHTLLDVHAELSRAWSEHHVAASA